MLINDSVGRKVTEATYLSTDNTYRYRVILRIAFNYYEKMKYWLYKEEIFEEIKKIDKFNSYTIESLTQDLDSLEKWGNFITIQDTNKTRTIEEFKNRKFQYQISPITIELERTLIKIENTKETVRGSLEVSLIERFKETLSKIEDIGKLSAKEIFAWWDMLNKDFKYLNENYHDYISKFYTPETEKLLKTTEFLVFKESFIKYLRDFIKGLQTNAFNIKYLLINLNDEKHKIDILVKQIVDYEKNNIALNLDYDEENAYEIHFGRYLSIKEWFIGHNGVPSISDTLLESTNEIIRKITRYALQIVEMQISGGNRKEEYKTLIDIFKKCSDISEAHKLSSVVFGVMNSKHIVCEMERETENINSGIYDEKPKEILVKPSNRYREKTASRQPIKDKSVIKKLRMKEILEKRNKEREIIESKIINNKLVFKDLDEITQNERTVFLKWLSQGLNKKSNDYIKNEYGRLYKVLNRNVTDTIIVKCEDGDFVMPNYELVFKEGSE